MTIRRRTFIVLACLVVGGCADFRLSPAQMRAADENAPWTDPPEATIIRPAAYGSARCFPTRPGHAVCLYRSSRTNRGEFGPVNAQAVVRNEDGAWTFDLASPNIHNWGSHCDALATVLATFPKADRRITRMMRTSAQGGAAFSPATVSAEIEAALERRRLRLHETSPDAVMACRFPPALGVRIEDGPLANARAPITLHFPVSLVEGPYVVVDHERRLPGGGVQRRRDLLLYRSATGDHIIAASMRLD